MDPQVQAKNICEKKRNCSIRLSLFIRECHLTLTCTKKVLYFHSTFMYGHKATKVGESGQAVTGTKRKENLCMGKFVIELEFF